MPSTTDRRPLQVLVAAPRGFCAGVDRAITIVERALEIYGAPVYVRHEIVHNKYVVDALKDKGAIFVETVAAIPLTSASSRAILESPSSILPRSSCVLSRLSTTSIPDSVS